MLRFLSLLRRGGGNLARSGKRVASAIRRGLPGLLPALAGERGLSGGWQRGGLNTRARRLDGFQQTDSRPRPLPIRPRRLRKQRQKTQEQRRALHSRRLAQRSVDVGDVPAKLLEEHGSLRRSKAQWQVYLVQLLTQPVALQHPQETG